MVDGEVAVMMMAMISSNSPSRQGARTEFLIPEIGFSMAAELWKVSGKSVDLPEVFRSEALNSPKGSAGGLQGGLTTPGRGQGPTAPQVRVVPLCTLFASSSGSVGLLEK